MTLQLAPRDIDQLVEILVDRAVTYGPGVETYFRHLITQTPLPKRWLIERLGGWTGDAEYNARELVRWAIGKGINPEDPRGGYTLASVLDRVLPQTGLDQSAVIVALITRHSLYVDRESMDRLRQMFQVPEPASSGPPDPLSLPLNSLGPGDEEELQSWLKPEPDLLDVGFLSRAIALAGSVCRVEVNGAGRTGTGTLVGPDLVLTNHHVLKYTGDEDLDQRARGTKVRFGLLTTAAGEPAEGQVFRTADAEPVVASSPTEQLDYALLRIEPGIRSAKGLQTAPFHLPVPAKGSNLNILQHPRDMTLKLAISGNAVAALAEPGKVRYVTTTMGGSSGAPCFNDDWQLVAIHQKERSTAFGSIREGILIAPIHREIARFL